MEEEERSNLLAVVRWLRENRRHLPPLVANRLVLVARPVPARTLPSVPVQQDNFLPHSGSVRHLGRSASDRIRSDIHTVGTGASRASESGCPAFAMRRPLHRYRMERPDVTSVTFHWHAWGDVGMATMPEAKLALEMIDMEFMPAAEGVAHFLNEFSTGRRGGTRRTARSYVATDW